MSRKVTLLKGLPASGKSTWAKAMVKKGQGHVKRVNMDSLRAMFDNGKFSKSNEIFCRVMWETSIGSALASGNSVIVDDTNLNPRWQTEVENIVTEYNSVTGNNVQFVVNDSFLSVSPEECIERDLKRGEASVGAKVILRMARKWLPAYKEVIPELDLEEALENGLPWCVIYDLDGTAAIMGDRSPYDASRCDELDRPNHALRAVLDAMDNDCMVAGCCSNLTFIAMSGRDGKYLAPTNRFINKHGFPCNAIYMRAEGDTRKDAVVKKELYEAYVKGKYNVLVVFDDRNQMIDMWRKDLGLPCFQVNYGDF